MTRAVAQDGKAAGGDLFSRIGAFLHDQRLSPEPAHYSFAYTVLSDPAGPLAKAVAELTDDGVRLSRTDIESLGGKAREGAAEEADDAGKLVEETHAQVEDLANVMRAMHDETRDFGRDLAARAEEMRRAGPTPGMAELARITGAMLSRIAESERRLADATRETEELRTKLAEARVVARRDPLTGLPNRRAFEEAYAAKQGRRLCLALCDVDRFKRINDGFGHGVGDRVLTAIGDTLRVACDGHLVARHGGEEFVVLIDGLPPEHAAELLEDARAGVSAKRFRSRETDRMIGRVTISVGLTAIGVGEDLDEVLARADRLLYTAKSTGRDRLCAD